MKVLPNGSIRLPKATTATAMRMGEVDPVRVLEERAAARARLWAAGEFPDLPAAVDPLQADAVRDGLTRQLGVDGVQRILAAAFAPYREGPAASAAHAAPDELDQDEPALEPACPTCGWAPCLSSSPGMCRTCRAADAKTDQERRRQSQAPQPRPRPTPQTTIDAIMYCIRTRGLASLREPANLERLRECDEAAIAEIKRRVAKLQEKSDAKRC